MTTLADQPSDEDYTSGNAVKHQMVMRLDYETWQTIRSQYGQDQPVIPRLTVEGGGGDEAASQPPASSS